MADARTFGELAATDEYVPPERAPVRITVRPQMEVAPPKSFEDYLGEVTQPREADVLQRPPVFGLTNRYVDPNDPTTQAGAQRLSNYYGLPGRLLAGDPRNVIQPEVPGQWSDRDEARAALQAGNMTLGGMGMGVDATTGAMPRGFAGATNTLGAGGGRPPRIGDVADLSGLTTPGVTVGNPPPQGIRTANMNVGPEGPTMRDIMQQESSPTFTGSGKAGIDYVDELARALGEQKGVPPVREVPREPIRRTVDYRDPSGRPVRTEPLPRSMQEILETGYKRATEPLPPGVEQPPLMQAAERKGAMGSVADLTTPQGIRAYHGSPHDFERFDISKIGTGEGAQVYGHGLYFAENPKVAEDYKLSLGRANPWTYEGKPVGPDTPYNVRNALDWLKNADKPGISTEEIIAKRIADLSEHGRFMAQASNPADRQAAKMYDYAVEALQSIDPAKLQAPRGRMYEVNINARPEQFLDWDKPLAQMGDPVKAALTDLPQFRGRLDPSDPIVGGQHIYSELENRAMSGADFYTAMEPEIARIHPRNYRAMTSEALREAGIPGIKYLDQGSRNVVDPRLISDVQRRIAYADEIGASPQAKQKLAAELAGYQDKLKAQTSNYVLFDDKLIDILRKYGLAGMLGGGAAAMGSTAKLDDYRKD